MASRRKRISYQDNCEKIALRRRLKIYGRRFYRIGFICVIFLLASLGFWFFKSDTPKTYAGFVSDRFLNITAKTGLKLERVSFEGNKYTGQEELAENLDLEYGKPILSFDLQKLRDEVKKQAWVKDAQVQRVLPSNLKIVITERKPIAIWQSGKKYFLIDSEGVRLTEVDSPDVLPFPLVVGDGANKEASHVFAVLGHEKKLFEQVQAAVMMGGRRWNILFNNGIEVMLPADNMEEAWEKLAKLDAQEQILERQIKSIDLRLPDRIYIKTLQGDVIKNSIRSRSA